MQLGMTLQCKFSTTRAKLFSATGKQRCIAYRFDALVQSSGRLASYGCGWVQTSTSPKVCLPLHHTATQQMGSNAPAIRHVSMQQSTTHASCCNTSSMQPAAMLQRIVSKTSGSHCGANSSKRCSRTSRCNMQSCRAPDA